MTTRLLIVEPNVRRRLTLQRVLSTVATVTACGDFENARKELLATRPDVLITNLRLREYNGLHLVALAGSRTRAIVCMDEPDHAISRAAEMMGASVEPPERVGAAALLCIGGGLAPAVAGPGRAYIRRGPAGNLK